MKDKGRTFPSKRLLCLLPALLVGCSEPEQTSSEIPLRSVKVAVVDASDNVTVRTFSGTVSSTQETSLSFRVSGTVIEKNVSVSDRVGRGDVLARLDPAPFELEVQRAIASVAEARSNARNASSSYDRTKRLYEAGNSSREDLDNAKTAADSALAQTASAAKALELAQLDLQYTRLVSEGSCAIALTDLQVGENVQQGQQVLVANCGDGLEVDLGIPERFISQIARGTNVSVSFPALPDASYVGMVDDVGISATSDGTTFPVTIALPEEASQQVKAGLSAQVTFSLQANSQARNGSASFVISPFAVGEDQSGRFVYVVEAADDGTGVVRRVEVTIGDLQDSGLEVLTGLSPGQLVVTAGVSVLRDGLEVSLPND
ncbi:MAG: efflux RND transporter periplasmic adaptor subunit [Kordiimonadaceae bacterium]|nr:efflux RND transporter periplasmic adaptor subunit [Kordiimonadaceae bacterium]MBO6568591.1 efflux RND transporter periplasmic adaptor subunit [Kordiimonadaceae bacterium]MBO6965433.1 efflux RND transporter periplasmic adaptor subunit [Kordiimonadaceae bacterium]